MATMRVQAPRRARRTTAARPALGAKPKPQSLRFAPATPGRWKDLEALFGPRGACAGCWCIWPRVSRAEFAQGKGEGNRRALGRIVAKGEEPGLIAYSGSTPVGWCALAPREVYRRLEKSRTLAPVDDRPVWSVVCFFIARPYRRTGMTVRLLRAAAQYAKRRGARILEGYPVEPMSGKTADAFAWTGLASAFRRAGFVEVARRSQTRPIMRYALVHGGAGVGGERRGHRKQAAARGSAAGARG